MFSDVFGDPTYADAILDRLVHNAHRLNRLQKLDWTTSSVPPITSQRGSGPGRHHVGIQGAIKSECLGVFIGIGTKT